MPRKFKIGHLVGYRSRVHERRTSRAVYRITSLLPSREAGGEPEYLIRSSIEGYERVVKESELIRLQRAQVNEGRENKTTRS